MMQQQLYKYLIEVYKPLNRHLAKGILHCTSISKCTLWQDMMYHIRKKLKIRGFLKWKMGGSGGGKKIIFEKQYNFYNINEMGEKE
jgi:hypothetical protein